MADVAVVTLPALTENATDVAPCATVTVWGTLAAAGFELPNDTSAPPLPAALVSVTMPAPD
jgi:hypothetical protein